jgi:outer membrane receptor protein involved in Fe transport
LEQPRPQLDANFQQRIGSRWSLSLQLRNIFNPDYKFIQRFKGEDYTFRNFTNGRRFVLGLSYTIN